MSRLRIAIAGCGRVFERCHAPALSRSADWEVCALCDPSEERRRRASAAFPRAAAFESLERLLDASRADALIVAAPHALHAALSRLGLGAGLHVLVEKPMARTASEAQELVVAASRAGRRLAVGFNRRFRRPYAAIRDGVERSAATAPRDASFELITDGGRWGLDPDPMGILLDVTSHAVDLVPWILGRPIRRVRASLGSPRSGEARADLEVDLGDGFRATCRTGTGPRHRESLRVRLEGRELGAPGRTGDLAGAIARRALRRPSLTVESFIDEHAAFAGLVRGKRSSIATELEGLQAALAVEACAESIAAGGEWVEVPRVGEEKKTVMPPSGPRLPWVQKAFSPPHLKVWREAGRSPAGARNVTPVILIGLDAVEVTLVDELCRAGRLPVLSALREEGCSGAIEAAQQAFLSMVWPTCTTGKQTTHHAWYSNKVWNPRRMCLEHIAGAGIRLEPFWELLDGSGMRSAILDVPFAPAPSPGFSGVFLSGWQNHDDHGKSCFPRGFRRDLERLFGRTAMKPELFGEQSLSTLLRLREESLASIAQFAEICGHVLETVRPELFFAVFGGAHRGGHYLWDDSQADMSAAGPGDRETIASARAELYEACDRALGRVLARAPAGARVLVFALHGMGVNTGWPEQLARVAGAVEARGGSRAGGGLVYRLKRAIPWKVARQVTTRIPHWANRALVPLWSRRMRDWSTVRWFPLPGDLHGFLKVNLKGRETPGVVAPGAEYEALIAELEESFLSFRDLETGAPIIEKVERVDDLGPPDSPVRDRLPDLILHWSAEPMGRSSAARSEIHGEVRWSPGAKLPSGRSGNHLGRGWLVARGEGIPAGPLAGKRDIVDIAPTVLRWLGVDAPRSLHGRPIEALSGEGEPLQPPGSAAGFPSSSRA